MRLLLDVRSVNGTHGHEASLLQSYGNMDERSTRSRLGNGCSQANVSSVLLQRRDGPCGLKKTGSLSSFT